jgi:uncharacterized surface protein with fasciclin (FAS1) repeats
MATSFFSRPKTPQELNVNKTIRFAALSLALTAAATALVTSVATRSAQAAARAATQDMNGMDMKKDIIETAVGPGMTDVTTLVAAIKAAGLVDALKGPGPFTVFAPTNAAFAKLPPGTVEDLLKPENKEKLTKILLYHVHKGDAIHAKDVKTMALTTLNGKDLEVKVEDDKVTVNGANVIKTDIICSNGIIHWVDTVILP